MKRRDPWTLVGGRRTLIPKTVETKNQLQKVITFRIHVKGDEIRQKRISYIMGTFINVQTHRENQPTNVIPRVHSIYSSGVIGIEIAIVSEVPYQVLGSLSLRHINDNQIQVWLTYL